MDDGFHRSGAEQVSSRTRWGPTLLLTALAVLYFFVATRSTPVPEGWGSDFDAALAQAAVEDRNVVIAFNMRGCPPCRAMDRTVLPDPAVRSALEGYIPVRADVDEQRELANRFGVQGTPTYAVVGSDGRLLTKCSGYQPVKTFVGFLELASTRARRDSAATAPHQPSGP